jgi:hypothetical protein
MDEHFGKNVRRKLLVFGPEELLEEAPTVSRITRVRFRLNGIIELFAQ